MRTALNIKFVFLRKRNEILISLTPQQNNKLKKILKEVISVNPYLGKSLKGKLKGLNSYRLNRKDRILYEIYEEDKTVLIIRARTHYAE